MESSDEDRVEGYLQKRFKGGMLKTLKKKWYVLEDGELRCYQSKDMYQQNSEMYQDCLPVSKVQAVRAASENRGVEVVTQQKTFILVAESAEDQQRWIKAIYETMKDNRPRSASSPTETTTKPSNRKRSSTGPKGGVSRIFAGFGKKSVDEPQSQCQSEFFVESHTAYSEVGVQADVKRITARKKIEESEKELDDNVFDTPDTSDNNPANQVHSEKSVEGKKSAESEQGSGPCSDRESPSYDSGITDGTRRVNSPDDLLEGVASTEPAADELVGYNDTKQEKGMHELMRMLGDTSLPASDGLERDAEEAEVEIGNEYEDIEDDEDWEGSLNGNETQEVKSAFDQLKELLQKT